MPDDCCSGPDPRIARHFDKRMRDLAESGQFPEMVDVSRALLDLLSDADALRPTLLELGCGSAALMVALLERGAVSAYGVDLSPESVATARRRAETAGVHSRVTFTVGDGSQVAVARHDWVVLDRVICCYPHIDALLGNSIGAASLRYAFSIPDTRGWRGVVNRLIRASENFMVRLGAEGCRSYTHSISMVDRRLRDAGFEPLRERKAGLWYAAVYERMRP